MKMKKRIFLSAMFAAAAIQLFAAETTFSSGETRLTLDPEAGKLIKLQLPESVPFTGGALWELTFFDEAARKANDHPLHGRGYYWQDPWKDAGMKLDATQASLKNLSFDEKNSLLTLEYSHPAAEVQITFRLMPEAVVFQGKFTNHAPDPVTDFAVCPGLAFRLTPGEDSVIVPDFATDGIEYAAPGYLPWSMCDAWDGFLIRTTRQFTAVFNVQNPDKGYLATNSVITGDKKENAAYTTTAVVFAETDQSRTGVATRIQAFPDLRQWADCYLAENFPAIRPLRERFDAETFTRLSRAYLAPSTEPMKKLAELVKKIPGVFILHTPGYMRPPAPGANGWDAFPNYFPPRSESGTMEEYRALIEETVQRGSLFMPRNSFFYWAEGTDVDRKYDLRKLAMIRVDGKVRTARWALPGYLVSPSSPEVLSLLEEFYQTWRGLGANVYFTNVIGAIGPYGNRYDFHPAAPAPDRFYEQIYRMMKKHGDRLPLLSEGGGAWQLPYQAGFAGHPNWNPAQPTAEFRLDPQRGTFLRTVPEVTLMLDHEFVKFYPHNAGSADSSDSIPKLSYSLVNGFNLKFGLVEAARLNDRNKRFLRTIALLAREIWSDIYGDRVESRDENNGIVRTSYASGEAIANFSEQPFQIGEHTVAPEGFFYRSADGKRLAGYFSSFNGTPLPRSELIVALCGDDNHTWRFHAPLAQSPVTIRFNGHEIVIPYYPAELQQEIPGVTFDSESGKISADPGGDSAPETRIETGFASPPTPATPSAPSRFAWKNGDEIPKNMRLENAEITPDGLKIHRNRGYAQIHSNDLVFKQRVTLELIFRYDRQPAYGNGNGEVYLLRPLSGARTIELRYNLYMDAVRFLIPQAGGGLADVSCPAVPIEAGRYYHVVATFDGEQQTLTVNGQTVSQRCRGPMAPNQPRWNIGDLSDLTVTYVRIDGE